VTWVVNATARPLYPRGTDPVPIVQVVGWAPGPVWTGAEDLAPTGIRSPDRPARSESLSRPTTSCILLRNGLPDYALSIAKHDNHQTTYPKTDGCWQWQVAVTSVPLHWKKRFVYVINIQLRKAPNKLLTYCGCTEVLQRRWLSCEMDGGLSESTSIILSSCHHHLLISLESLHWKPSRNDHLC
jgi:hypothetical protein